MTLFKTRYYIYFVQTLSFLISVIVNQNRKFISSEVKDILIIRIDRLGDFLMSMPVFHSLRSHFPNRKITLLTGFNIKTMIAGNPLFDEVIFYNSQEYMNEGFRIRRLIECTQLLIKLKRYDLIIDLRSDLPIVLLSLLKVNYYRVDWGTIRTAERMNRFISEQKSGNSTDYKNINNKLMKLGFLSKYYQLCQRQDWKRHYVQMISSILNYVNIFEKNRDMNIDIKDQKTRYVKNIFKKWKLNGSPVIGVHPGAGNKSKAWEIENVAFILNKLSEKHKYDLILINGPGEEYLVNRLQGILKNKAICFYNPDLQIVGALLRRLNLLICNDSGIMHLSKAVGTATVAVFTKTDPFFYGTRNPRNIDIRVPERNDVAREMVYRAVHQLAFKQETSHG